MGSDACAIHASSELAQGAPGGAALRVARQALAGAPAGVEQRAQLDHALAQQDLGRGFRAVAVHHDLRFAPYQRKFGRYTAERQEHLATRALRERQCPGHEIGQRRQLVVRHAVTQQELA